MLILDTEPFTSLPTTFRIALAERCSGNLATVIGDHPVFNDLPPTDFADGSLGTLWKRVMQYALNVMMYLLTLLLRWYLLTNLQ